MFPQYKSMNWPSYLYAFGGGRSINWYNAGLYISYPVKRTVSLYNVRAVQVPGSKRVDVLYDMEGTGGGTGNVSLKLYVDGKNIDARMFSGAIGSGIMSGKNLSITWDAGKDWPENFSDNVVVVVTAGDSLARSATFDVDTRSKGFRITDVSNAYCSGLYGGIGGKKAMFLSDISCKVRFYVWFENDEPDLDHLLVNGIAFPVMRDFSLLDEVGFPFDMSSLRAGDRLEVVAVRKDGKKTEPFRVNVDIASPPPMWGTWKTRVLLDKSPEDRVEYYTLDLNTVWLWDNIANGIEFIAPGMELDAFVEMIPLLRLWETFDTLTGRYRIGAQGGIKGNTLKNLIDKKSYQSLGEFAGEELGFKIGQEANLDLGGQLGGGLIYEWDPYVQKWNCIGGDLRGRLTLAASISNTNFNGDKNRFDVNSSVGENAANALRLLRSKAEIGATIVSGELVIKDVDGKLSCDFALDPLLNFYATAACNTLMFNGRFGANAGLVLRGAIDSEPDSETASFLTKWGYLANVSLRATLLGYELVDYSHDWGRWWIDREANTFKAAKLMSAAPNDVVPVGFQLMGRDYSDYPNPSPALAANGVRDVLVSLRDNPARAAVNRTEMVCQSGTSNEWNSIETVWDDGTADFMPQVAVSQDGRVFAAWANANRALADSDPLETMCAAMEIAVGVRDVATGAWVCRNLTDNTVLDINPVLRAAPDGSAAVAWVSNGAGLFIGSAEKPSAVMLSTFRGGTWSEPVKVADVGMLLSLDLAWNGTVAEVVWSKDGDDNLETSGDRETWGAAVTGGTVGAVARISEAGVDAACPHVWYDAGGFLRKVWLADGVLVADDGKAIAGADALGLAEDFVFLPRPGGGVSLVWWQLGKDGVGGKLVAATYDTAAGKVGETVAIGSSSATQERAVTGAVGADGALRLAYESVAVATNATGGAELGAVVLRTERREAGIDIGVSAVSFGGDVEVGGLTDVRVTVSNGGCAEAKGVDVWLWFGEGERKSLVSVVTKDMLPLSSTTVSIPWYMGKSLTNIVFTVEVDPQREIADVNRADNVFVWSPDLGSPQLAFSSARCINVSETVRSIDAIICNEGLVTLSPGTVVNLWRGAADGELLKSDTLGSIAAGEEWNAGFELNISDLADFAEYERIVIELVAGAVHPKISVVVAKEVEKAPEAVIEESYIVTFDMQSGTGGTESVKAVYGSAMPSIAVPVRSGYMFGGYYTSPDGNGTQYYTSSGASAHKWDLTTATTLYALWNTSSGATFVIENGELSAVNLNGSSSVKIPDGVTKIGARVFLNCTGLESVIIPETVTSIGTAAFSGCSGLTGIVIPVGVTNISAYAFNRCASLKSATIPEGVTNVGFAAFYGCSGLTNLTLPQSLMNIEQNAFQNCSGLQSLALPNGVSSIEDYAFYGCAGLTELTIGTGVKSIGSYAFYNCSALTRILLFGNAPSVGRDAFSPMNDACTIYVPRESTGWNIDIPGTWNGIRIEYGDEGIYAVMFVETKEVIDEGGAATIKVMGGNADAAASVKVYLTYNTAAAADVDLAKGTVDGTTPKGGLKFPLTLSWAKGEVGEKVITIPVKTDKTVEDDEFFTLQLAEAVGMELGEERVCTVTIRDMNDKTLKTTVTPYKPKKGELVSTNSVTVAAGNAKGGFVSGTGEYTAGSKLTLTAEARPGWAFVGWRRAGDSAPYQDILSTKAKWQVVVTNDEEYVAVFEKIPYVRGLADPADGGKVSGSGLCDKGKKVTLKASANKNYTFLGWAMGSVAIDGNREQSNAIEYIATTPSLVIDRSAKPAANSKTSTTITEIDGDVTYYAVFKSDPEVLAIVDATDGKGAEPTGKGVGKYVAGTITGEGKYAPGKKVTLKATANKGYVFAGWDSQSIAIDSNRQQSSISFEMPSDDVECVAKFVTADEDKGSIKLSVDGEEMEAAGAGRPPYRTNIWCGVYLEWSVAANALSESKVKVAGLPAGLKFTEKPVTSKIGSGKTAVVVTNVPANTIYGAPTAASKIDKNGNVTPSAVKFTVTTAGKSTQTYQIDTTVEALPAWAQGTFEGGWRGAPALPGEDGHAGRVTLPGQVSLAIDAKGKISGKALGDGLTYTLAAPYYAGFEMAEGVSNFLADVTASWSYKEGTKTIKTNEVVQLVVQDNGIGGVAMGWAAAWGHAALPDDGGQGLAALPVWTAWQNLWKVEPWKTLGKSFDKKTMTYAIREDDTFIDDDDAATVALGEEVVGRVTLKFAASGTVTVAGEFVTGYNEKTKKYTTVKATGSAMLVPVDDGHGEVFIYLVPKGLSPHARCIDVPWHLEQN